MSFIGDIMGKKETTIAIFPKGKSTNRTGVPIQGT